MASSTHSRRGWVTTEPTSARPLTQIIRMCYPGAEPVRGERWKANTTESIRQNNWILLLLHHSWIPCHCQGASGEQFGMWWHIPSSWASSGGTWQGWRAMRWKMRTVRLKSVWMQQRGLKKHRGYEIGKQRRRQNGDKQPKHAQVQEM